VRTKLDSSTFLLILSTQNQK